MASRKQAQPSLRTGPFDVVASGLSMPEGPFYCADGTLLVAQVGAGLLSRIDVASKTMKTVAKLGGGPNGTAVGPDGYIYVCNDGGFDDNLIPQTSPPGVLHVPLQQPANYSGGRIQKVSPDGETVVDLYTHFQGNSPFSPGFWPLRSPDDLVFDRTGHFWFTDWGKDRLSKRDRDITGVYYAAPDGSAIEEKIFPLKSPNGIALSPHEDRLYVAETWTRRILYWELSDYGKIKPNPKTLDGSYWLEIEIPEQASLDSMSIDCEGNIYAVSILPHGFDPNNKGGITVISPAGELVDRIELDCGQPDPLPSNICFGGEDLKTAYITMSGTGRVLSCPMAIAGKRPAFE